MSQNFAHVWLFALAFSANHIERSSNFPSRDHLRAFLIILSEELEGLEDWLWALHALRPEASVDFSDVFHAVDHQDRNGISDLTMCGDVGHNFGAKTFFGAY